MALPLKPPIAPQLAKSAKDLPDGDGWRFEPKWDGFRTIVFRDGDDVHLQSRNGRPMNRYFPEVIPQVLSLPGERLVLKSCFQTSGWTLIPQNVNGTDPLFLLEATGSDNLCMAAANLSTETTPCTSRAWTIDRGVSRRRTQHAPRSAGQDRPRTRPAT